MFSISDQTEDLDCAELCNSKSKFQRKFKFGTLFTMWVAFI